MLEAFLALNLVLLTLALVIERGAIMQFFWLMLLGISFIISMRWIQSDRPEACFPLLYFMILSNFITLTFLPLSNRKKTLPLTGDPLRSRVNFSVISILLLAGSLILTLGTVGGRVSDFLQSWDKLYIATENEHVLRNAATLTYLGGLGTARCAIRQGAPRLILLAIFLLALVFVIILRAKIFIVPLILSFVLFDQQNQKRNLIRTGTTSLLLISSYFGVMYIRRLAGIDLSFIFAAASSVLDSGLEEGLMKEYCAVFKYFELHPFLDGDTYLRLILHPLSFLFVLDAPKNPIYLYHSISYDTVGLMVGSAHPTLYGDSYANFGWLGVLILPLIYLVVVRLSMRHVRLDCFHDIRYVGFFIGLPLILRGSVYYGIFYILICIATEISIRAFFSRYCMERR